ncbi:hypothetical protein PAHAL_8G170000 [Panicum hallii]|uniref:Uncharacterized protein n=1 Tax=Panicum hallii TaxID=206008 RepID=A0A2T8I974_9POAL|nr:hypothetical protein PAHAL_8G170000 [Panicum hallii]
MLAQLLPCPPPCEVLISDLVCFIYLREFGEASDGSKQILSPCAIRHHAALKGSSPGRHFWKEC